MSTSVRDHHHGTPSPRGLTAVPHAHFDGGRFGRLFRRLPPCEADDGDLHRLAATMIETTKDAEDDVPTNNPDVSAGYTYFAQFVDHDLTFDPTSVLQRLNDPEGLEDFRTPRFDLDNLYGRGPMDSPFMYDGDKLRLDLSEDGRPDLPRSSVGRALIGDPRNDENLIVSQLHLAFLQFHNNVVDTLGGSAGFDRFQAARQIVQDHYQWLVLHELLPLIVGRPLLEALLPEELHPFLVRGAVQQVGVRRPRLTLYHPRVRPFMPVEFSAAAYRFGHSMVRFDYTLNERGEVPLFSRDATGNDLSGFRRRPAGRTIEWFRFFPMPWVSEDRGALQRARSFDTLISAGLAHLPASLSAGGPVSLPERNLLRGKALGLPSGQAVAAAMGLPGSLILSAGNGSTAPFQIAPRFRSPSAPKLEKGDADELTRRFGESTPLWYYVLKEAEVLNDGRALGPVGGRIVAETMLGILYGDSSSFVNTRPNWTPRSGRFGARLDGTFTVGHFLEFAGRTLG
jgi:hypothetical protein